MLKRDVAKRFCNMYVRNIFKLEDFNFFTLHLYITMMSLFCGSSGHRRRRGTAEQRNSLRTDPW